MFSIAGREATGSLTISRFFAFFRFTFAFCSFCFGVAIFASLQPRRCQLLWLHGLIRQHRQVPGRVGYAPSGK